MTSKEQGVATAVRRCAGDLIRHLDAAGGDPTIAGEEIKASIARLMTHPDLFDVGIVRPANHGESSRIIYYDPKLVMIFGVTRVGQMDPPHNHGTWLATAVYRGELRYEGYLRRDDGSRAGYAELDCVESRVMKPGDVALCGVPPNDIHITVPLVDTWALVVAGGAFNKVREYYDPKKRQRWEKSEKAT